MGAKEAQAEIEGEIIESQRENGKSKVVQSLGTRVVEVKTSVPLNLACLLEGFYELDSC